MGLTCKSNPVLWVFFFLPCYSAPRETREAVPLWQLRRIEWRHKSKKAGWNRGSHARHAASDTWEDEAQTQIPDWRGSRCQTSLQSAEVKGDNAEYQVMLTDGRHCKEAENTAHLCSPGRTRCSVWKHLLYTHLKIKMLKLWCLPLRMIVCIKSWN